MSMQKKVWGGAAVVLAAALLVPTVTAYANRQREAAKAAVLTEAQRQMQRDAEAARWEGLALHRRAEYGAAETGAMQEALSVAPAAEAEALSSSGFSYVDGETGSQLAAEHPWTSGDPRPVYDSTGANVDAPRPDLAATAEAAPTLDWYAERAKMTAVPGYNPAAAVPTVVPQGP